ncbi:MAG: hypothetical protein PSV23_12590 [Brevundimonas sp.]|uniref:hypothetical protein n=1 Tax=Brevundimonas sp. TaxID=1871086 RepID=UPI00248927B6|nr:hypothetical protein [Brevundimonas sp.]MDI1327622.1 hypothetical protein [Brevundimonas sp.]
MRPPGERRETAPADREGQAGARASEADGDDRNVGDGPDTGVHATGFHGRFGFVIEAVQRDGHAPGGDRYDMRLTF